MPTNTKLNGACLVLVAIASIMLHLALSNRLAFSSAEWIHLIAVALLSLIIYRNTPWQEKGKASLAITSASMLLLVTLPFFYNALLRSTNLWGYLLDIQVTLLLRNVMFGLVVVQSGKKEHKLAALASCFVVLFSTLWLMDRWMVVLLFIYTIVGMWWLMGTCWEKISDVFLSGSERYIPWKPLGAASGIGITSLLILLPLSTGIGVTTAIDGFMPSSGGTRWHDDFAHGGVGDGQQMVSAKENASTFGPVESELFLESKMPSLYDVFNEMYGEPPKPSRKRAIPLAPNFMQENHKKLETNQKTSREFSVVRRGKEKQVESKGSKSPALIQVAGRVPVHLGLYSYDMWNGSTLSSSNSSPARKLYLDKKSTSDRAWARYTDSNLNKLLSHRDRHEMRIINLKTDRVPSPPNLSGVHVDQLHTETFFKVKEDGMLYMDMDFIPQLSVLHVESLQRSFWNTPRPITSPASIIDEEDPIALLAAEWTSSLEEPWQKIEEVCWRLRREYILDAEYVTPEVTEDAAHHFLFESKRGPDHHFAISAALLIRSLGYDARVISGFYADPENYDRPSRLTSVYPEDAHFWIEVLASPNEQTTVGNLIQYKWIALDPSPGYEVLLAPESLWSRMMTHAALMMRAIKRNPVPSLLLLTICIFMFIQRSAIGILVVTLWWELHHRLGDQRHQIISTLRLVKRRAYLHGMPNPQSAPLSKWTFAGDLKAKVDAKRSSASFTDLANWALYGEGIPLESTDHEVNSLCRQTAGEGYPNFRRSST